MNEILSETLNLLLLGIEILILAFLTSSIFTEKRAFKYIAFVSACTIIINYICLKVLAEVPVAKFLLTTVVLSIWMVLSFRLRLGRCVFLSLFFQAYLTLTDSAAIYLVSRHLDISYSDFFFGPTEYYAVCFFIKIIELFGILILRTLLRRHFQPAYTDVGGWAKTLIFPATSLIVSFYLSDLLFKYPAAGPEVLICIAIMLFADLMSVFLLEYIDQQKNKLRRSDMLRQNMKAELDNVSILQEAYVEQRRMTHEFQNQLATIKGMLSKDGNTNAALAYIDQLQGRISPVRNIVNTHRPAADAVINQESSAARSEGIYLRLQLDDLSAVAIPDSELVIILANLLDNAIEACRKIDKAEDRLILLKIKVFDGTTFLHIENTSAEVVTVKGNRIVTSKQNKLQHGYGLQNITSAIERHGGSYTIQYDPKQGKFIFSAQF